MKKLESQNINFNNTVARSNVNGHKIPVAYSPLNYTPVATAGESLDMLSAHLLGIDQRLAQIGSASASFTDQVFTADGVVFDYQLSNPFDASTKMDWYVDGFLQTVLVDYLRSASLNKITTYDNTVPANLVLVSGVKLRSRIYNSGFSFSDEDFLGNDSVSTFILSNSIDANSLIDVFFNGRLGTEGSDWQRNVGSGAVEYLGPGATIANLPNNTAMKVRIHNVTHTDESFSGGVASVITSVNFETISKLDIFIGGRLGTEGSDWTKDAGTNTVTIIDGLIVTDSNTTIKVRIWPT